MIQPNQPLLRCEIFIHSPYRYTPCHDTTLLQPTLYGVVRQPYESVCDAGLVVGQTGSGHIVDDLKVIGRLHVDGHVLKHLVVESVSAVELTNTNMEE